MSHSTAVGKRIARAYQEQFSLGHQQALQRLEAEVAAYREQTPEVGFIAAVVAVADGHGLHYSKEADQERRARLRARKQKGHPDE